VYARHVDIDEYNSILADDDAYIDDNHADDDLNEQETRFVGESYAIDPLTEAPDQPSLEERKVNINDLVDNRLGDEEIERSQPDTEYVPNPTASIGQKTGYREGSRRHRKASRKARDNLLGEDEIPLDDDVLPTLHTITTAIPDDPQSLEEAMQRPDWDQWLKAVIKEVEGIIAQRTWTVMDRTAVPPQHHIHSGKWVLTRKRDGRYKARWVIRGFEQIQGLNYQETYAAVVRSDSYRCLIAIAAFFGLSIETVDIDLAFLYGKIDYDIYTELPTAMFDAYLVCKLLKSLYGLKQAPRIWYETLRKALTVPSH
jgi:hypothetical protein